MGTPHKQTTSAQYVNTHDVLSILPISASCLKAWISKGRFPAPISALSARRSWWLRADIQRWLADNGLPPLSTPSSVSGAE